MIPSTFIWGASAASLTGQIGRSIEGHRYWGIHIPASAATAALAFNEVMMFDQLGGTSLLTNPDKADATSWYVGGFGDTPPDHAVDGDEATVFGTTDASEDVIWWYDFGASSKSIISVWMIGRGDQGSAQNISTFDVVYSDDAESWTTAWTVTPEFVITSNKTTSSLTFSPEFSMPETKDIQPHRYWGIRCETSSYNAFSCATLDLRAVPGGANIATGGTAGGDPYYPGQSWANAFDNNNSTLWGTSGKQPGQRLWYDFGEGNAVVVNELRMKARSGSDSGQTPTKFHVIFSDDGVEWTPLWTVSTTAWSSSEERVFTAPTLFVASS